MQVVSNIALISINETLIIQLLSFLIFLFIINRIMFRPLRKVMDEREDYIQKIKQGVIDAENEMKSITTRLDDQERAARDEAFAFKAELEKSGCEKASEIYHSAKQEIDQLKEKSEKEVEAEMTEARKMLKAESKQLAAGIVEKILNRRLAL